MNKIEEKRWMAWSNACQRSYRRWRSGWRRSRWLTDLSVQTWTWNYKAGWVWVRLDRDPPGSSHSWASSHSQYCSLKKHRVQLQQRVSESWKSLLNGRFISFLPNYIVDEFFNCIFLMLWPPQGEWITDDVFNFVQVTKKKMHIKRLVCGGLEVKERHLSFPLCPVTSRLQL